MLQRASLAKNGNNQLNIFSGEGEMASLMRAYNWDAHPLGHPNHWPLSLQANIRLMLGSGFPMFIWWSNEFYMFHNDAYLPALGKKHPEAFGARAREMWSEIWGQLGLVAEGIMENASKFYAEEMLILLDRKGFIEETYWTFSYSPAFNDQGKVEGVFCACSEVTSTVLNQRRLRALKDISEAMNTTQSLEQACQLASDVLHNDISDIPFNLIYLINNTGTEARLVGSAGNLVPGLTPEVISLKGDKKSGKWPLREVKQKMQEMVVSDLTAEDFLGQDITGEGSSNQAVVLPILKPGQEEVIGYFISGISSRLEYDNNYLNFHQLLAGQFATLITSVQAREELARQQEYLEELFEQAPVAITILNGPDYVVELANPLMCELWGRKPEEVLRKPVLEAIPEAREQGIKQLLDGVLTTGVPYINTELPLMLKRNDQLETVYVSFVYHPMRNAKGEISGVIAVATVINDQVKARQEIEEMNRELLSINADLDNFVYSASHDLRAPISNIEGLMEALIEYLPADALTSSEVQLLIDHMQGSIDRFKRVVTDLTQVAKIQRETEDDVAQVNLQEVVDEVLLDFTAKMAEIGVDVDKEIQSDTFIRFSTKNLRSVVYNLISNAIKYHSPDRKPVIRIATEETPEHLIFSVTDNGLGMNLTDERKIFSMFKRLHDHVEGTGVGLYIVKKIIENAGGKIEVDSEVGKGSTFKIYFRR